VNERLLRLSPAMQALTFSSIPLFPSFITLTGVAFPGVSVIPPPAAVALLVLTGLFAIYTAIFALVPPRTGSPIGSSMVWLFAAWAVAVAFGLDRRDGVLFLAIFGVSELWHVTILRAYEAPSAARAIWWSFTLAGTLACLVAIVMVFTRVPAVQYAVTNGRAVGTFVLPGELAGFLIAFLPAMYGLSRTAREPALRTCARVGIAAGSIAMVMTFSRAGWIGLASAIAVYVMIRARGARAGITIAVATIAAALVIVLAFFNEHHNPSENYTRLAIWQAAIGSIDRFPLTGVGPFGFSHVYPLVRLPGGDATAFHAHSLYLSLFADLGVLGVGTLLWVIASFARAMHDALRNASAGAALLASALAAGVAGMLVQGLIDTVSIVIFCLLFSMMALALASARAGTGDA
jgi:O-antigen ligase